MKIFYLFIFLFFNFYNSQVYEFDYMLKSTNTRETGEQYNMFDLVNSKNHQLYMELGKNTIYNHYYSILLDFQKNVAHRFDLGDSIDTSLNFYYTRSHNFNQDKKLIKYNELIIEKLDNLKYKVICKNNKSEKTELEIILQLVPFQDDLLILEFEPLIYTQQKEIEELIKNRLKIENIIGDFYINEITFKYFKDKVCIKKNIPQKVDVMIDLTRILKNENR